MHNEEKRLDEQDHPLKNTDRAFVKVGKDGEPVIPANADEKKQEQAGEKENITYDRP